MLNKFTFIKQGGDTLTFLLICFYKFKVPLLQNRYVANPNTAEIYIIVVLLLCIPQCTSGETVANMA